MTPSADARCGFGGDDNHLFFQIGNRLLMTRKLTGNFPDYERVLPKDHNLIAKLQKDEIRAAIERVAQFADERSRAIRVQFAPGEVRIFSSRLRRARARRASPANTTGRISRSASTRSTCWISCASIPQDQSWLSS